LDFMFSSLFVWDEIVRVWNNETVMKEFRNEILSCLTYLTMNMQVWGTCRENG
jgi:hypothetical protein